MKRFDPAIEAAIKNISAKVPDKSRLDAAYAGEFEGEERKLYLRTIPITWGIPLDEVMFSKFLSNFFRLGFMPWDSVCTTESTYLPEARNIIHKGFLDNQKSKYLFMLDSDVLPPPDVVRKLMAYNLPIVGGWYRGKRKPGYPIVYDYDHTNDKGILNYKQRKVEGHGLEKVGAAGAGCWLMRRDVAEAIGEKPYDMNSGGEDLLLCNKITKAGFDIYIDWDLACAHTGVFYV